MPPEPDASTVNAPLATTAPRVPPEPVTASPSSRGSVRLYLMSPLDEVSGLLPRTRVPSFTVDVSRLRTSRPAVTVSFPALPEARLRSPLVSSRTARTPSTGRCSVVTGPGPLPTAQPAIDNAATAAASTPRTVRIPLLSVGRLDGPLVRADGERCIMQGWRSRGPSQAAMPVTWGLGGGPL